VEVVRITPRGYCHGVVEAIRIAKRVGAERSTQEPVTMLGYLVHNEHVTRELQEAGVKLVEESDRMKGLDQVREGTVIFTAHGISPAVVEAARTRGLNVVDATCSDVTRTHDLVRRLVDDGFHVVYIGKRGHPEPAGLGDAFELLDHLRGQLAGGNEDQRRRLGAVPLQPLHDGNGESERFARAGPRSGEDVAAGQGVAHDQSLDGERRGEPTPGERLGHRRGHAEVGEGVRGHTLNSSCGLRGRNDPARPLFPGCRTVQQEELRK